MTDNKQPIESEAYIPSLEQPEDFLSPEQRMKAIADVLSTIAIRIVKKRYENTESQPN